MRVPSIIVTVGQAGINAHNMRELLNYNISFLRFNTGRCSIEWICDTIDKLKSIGFRDEQFLIDIGNFKPRVIFPRSNCFSFEKDKIYTLAFETTADIVLNSRNILESLQPGDIIVFGDGEIEASVVRNDNGFLHVCALNSGIEEDGVAIRKKGDSDSIHFELPQAHINSINKLLKCTRAGIVLSFVEKAENVYYARQLFPLASVIIPKIETVAAVDNLIEICKSSDIIFIGRGDLSLAMGWNKIGLLQQNIIRSAKKCGCKICVGTGTLNTLQWNETPSSAEVVDVTNSALQGVDWVVLTSETGGSTNPFHSIKQLSVILSYLEGERL